MIYNISNLLDKYLKYLEFNKSFSKLTLKSYKLDLGQFFSLSAKKKTKKNEVLKKNTKELTQFLKVKINKYKHKNHWSPATKNRKIASLKSFFKWLYQNRYIDEDLNRKIKSPKIPHKIPHFLSIDEVFSLIETIKKNQEHKKDLTLILLLYGGGLRVSEACSAKWSDLDISRQTLKIKGKGSKERLIILPDMVIQHLISIKDKIKNHENKGYIFGCSLPQRKAFSIVRDWGVKSGLKKNISPHVLRHSYATHMLDSGSNLRVLQSLLGHQSLSATQKYTQVQLSKLVRTLNQFHPLSKTQKK